MFPHLIYGETEAQELTGSLRLLVFNLRHILLMSCVELRLNGSFDMFPKFSKHSVIDS